MTAPTITPLLYRIPDAMTALNLSRGTIYDLIRTGQLRVVHIGRSCRIPATAITEYLAHLETQTPQGAAQ